MELKTGANNSFAMTLLGYQFPDLAHAPYDSNWLNVKIEVNKEQGNWSATDPSVLTYEIAELIDWLRAVSSGEYSERELEFLEPYISFHLAPAKGAPDKLVVELTDYFVPPWADAGPFERYQIAFPLASIDLLGAAQSLESQLRQYPQRTPR
jgi:hypothetical protein